jgi:hypothetical protein
MLVRSRGFLEETLESPSRSRRVLVEARALRDCRMMSCSVACLNNATTPVRHCTLPRRHVRSCTRSEGENPNTDGEAELYRLGALVGQTPQELYSHTAELRRRDLMQARGPWRAVLPHAVAARLATIALQNIPLATIQMFLRDAPLRLLRSFSRRLHYLGSAEAQRLIREKCSSPAENAVSGGSLPPSQASQPRLWLLRP